MSELPQPPPLLSDPELEAAIRRNVTVYWSPETDYGERLQAQAALKGLAVEGFRELLVVVDTYRAALRASRLRDRIEREDIVAFLRRNPGVSRAPECITDMTPFECADAIEAGRHLRVSPEGERRSESS
jgi:hypothetical protein